MKHLHQKMLMWVRSLRGQLLTIPVVMLLLPISAVLATGYIAYERYLVPVHRRELGETASDFQESLEEHLAMRLRELQDICHSLALPHEPVDSWLLQKTLASHHTAFGSLLLLDSNNHVLAASVPVTRDALFRHSQLLRRVARGEYVVGLLRNSELEGGLVVPLAVPFPAATPEGHARVLVANLYWSDLLPIVQSTVRRDGDGHVLQFAIFLDHQGRVLLAPDFLLGRLFPLERHRLFAGPPIPAAGANVTVTFGDTNYNVIAQPLQGREWAPWGRRGTAGWSSVALLFEDARVSTTPRFALVVWMICILTFAVAATWFFHCLIIRPMYRQLNGLMVATEQMTRGKAAKPVAVLSKNELGKLAARFNLMSRTLTRDRSLLEKRAAELELANKKLKESDVVKTRFLSTVSHELRTPLSAMLSSARIIKRYHSSRPEAVPRFAETIESEGNRLTRLINDVLDLTKVESGKLAWKDGEVDPAELVVTVLENLRCLAVEHRIRLEQDIAPALPQLWADRDRLQQLLGNLLNNAIKFTPRDGTITVAAEVRDGELLVSVTDTGCGIPEDAIAKVFDKFYQSGYRDLVDKPVGTGLGLAICREIVNHYGGRIWVESTVGKGSTFKFTLPARSGRAAAQTGLSRAVDERSGSVAGPSPAARGNGGVGKVGTGPSLFRVLLLSEDRERSQRGLWLLRTVDIEARACGSVAELLDILPAWNTDVVVVESSFETQLSAEVLRRIQEAGVAHVLVASDRGRFVEVLQAGPVDCLLRAMRRLMTPGSEILVVDDNKAYLSMLAFELEQVGYSVATATTGAAALDYLKGHEPATMLLDLIMPEMDGLAVLEKLADSGRKLPVVVLTAMEDDAVDTAARNLGAAQVFRKHEMEQMRYSVTTARIRQVLEPLFAADSASAAPTGLGAYEPT